MDLYEKIEEIKRDILEIKNIECKGIGSLKNAKKEIYELNKLLGDINNLSDLITQKISQKQNFINKNINTYDKKLQKVERVFNVKNYFTKRINKKVLVDIGSDIKVSCVFYKDIYMIPDNSYGAVLIDNKMRVVYKYTDNFYVSCTDIIINESYTTNFRTICCNNRNNCIYGNGCRYFHDPILWKDSDHIQQFYKSHMIKKYPNFGDRSKFNMIKGTINLEELRTIARYCSIMNLLIQNALNDD